MKPITLLLVGLALLFTSPLLFAQTNFAGSQMGTKPDEPTKVRSTFLGSRKKKERTKKKKLADVQPSLTPSQIYKNYDPAVVIIKLSHKGRYAGHGSGFLVKSNGFILTNYHVLDTSDFGDYSNQIEVEVLVQNGRAYTPRIIKTDKALDLALLKIDGNELPSVNMGQLSQVQVGEDVVIIGTPIRLEFSHSLTKGVISGFNRVGGRIQTSAIIHGGNSGGPAFNLKGEVIGIAVAVAAGEDRGSALVNESLVDLVTQQEYYGITYLIPINFAKNLLNLMY